MGEIMELLLPAGNLDSLKMAINNGADAVYLSGKSFGARAYAKNFDNKELKDAIDLGHLYNVKIYITMNTLIKECEVEDFINQVEYLYKCGVDAIIMQDFGMISLCRSKFPNLEIHASTQFNSTSLETIDLLYKMGVKRVVLPREFSIEDIKKIKTPIELEVFIHGALCVSYSGRCLMSALLGGRSGNRGECTGCCRLCYDLKKDNKVIDKGYLLSMKELNLSEKIKELESLGIASLKIEGRMKSPTYVGYIAKYYRNILDNKKNNLDELKILFNRGFTLGRLYDDKDIINKESPNHQGLEIGKVIDINNKKIKIKLFKELNQEDGIRFKESNKGMVANFIYDSRDKLVSHSSDIVYLDNKVDLKTLDTVCKTTSKVLEDSYKVEINKKIGVKLYCKANLDDFLELTLIDEDNNTVMLKGNKIEKSINYPITYDKLVNQLSRFNDTIFKLDEIDVEMDSNIFINIKDINELRRNAVSDLMQLRKKSKYEPVIKEVILEPISGVNKYKEAINMVDKIVDGARMDTSDLDIYNKYKDNPNVYYVVPLNTLEISKHLQERNVLSEIIDCTSIHAIGSYHLNVYNSYTAYYLYKLGYKSICLSIELNEYEKQQIIDKLDIPFEVNYGEYEVMMIKGNILNIKENEEYELVNQNKVSFKALYDGVLTHIKYKSEEDVKNIEKVTIKIN